MEFSSFLENVQSDGDRLALVARDHLGAGVPPCPGWQVRDVVTHVAEVYEQKIASTLFQQDPDPWPPAWPADRDPVEWLADAQRRLLELFTERGPAAPSHTWWPADQTVGFWARRMAQETVIHRVDVELSCGLSSPVTPELAVDGVDEVLAIFLAGDWSDEPADECRGQRIVVRTRGRGWEVELLPEAIHVYPPRRHADAEVSGEPQAVFLWLWGRGPATGLSHSGDASVATLLRNRLKLATQ
ncbi:MAG TPA: maleylpyruvate isomerase family mycothiol-dependent enzyme [Candidatus Dormibacteraeota bacterium]|nr:maleylpyruvate isomerase family mycothiol-dependent enzyme [Candidatus Dormibacteraeota bacterium]